MTSRPAWIRPTRNAGNVQTAAENPSPPQPHAYSHGHNPPLLFMDDWLAVCVCVSQHRYGNRFYYSATVYSRTAVT